MLTIERVEQGRDTRTVFVELHSHLGTIEPRHLELTSFRGNDVEVYERDADSIYIFVCHLSKMDKTAARPLARVWKAGMRKLGVAPVARGLWP